MADFPFEKLLEPLAEDQPCGPDLDFEGDADFMGFTARIEGVLPQSFFTFDRASIDFPAEFKAIAELSGRSIDLRLLVPLAKLLILNRDIDGFEKAVAVMRRLIAERWESLNPQLLDGDAVMRLITLQTLDDMPNTVLPLQVAPLFRTRRFGPVSYRAYLLSEGKIQPRRGGGEDGDDEKTPSQSDIKTAVQEVEIADLVAARDRMARLVESIAGIEQSMDDLSGQIGQLRFAQLKAQAQGMHEFLDASCALRDPSLGTLTPKAKSEEHEGPASGGAPKSQAAGVIETRAEAEEALRAAMAYFARNERSSPIRFLLAQAHHLAGKSFYDALRALVPDHASSASLRLARDLPFMLPIDRLAELVDEAEQGLDLDLPDEAGGGETAEESSSSSDGWGSWDSASTTEEETPAEETPAEAESSDSSWGSDWSSSSETEAEVESADDSGEPGDDAGESDEVSEAEESGGDAEATKTRDEPSGEAEDEDAGGEKAVKEEA